MFPATPQAGFPFGCVKVAKPLSAASTMLGSPLPRTVSAITTSVYLVEGKAEKAFVQSSKYDR